MTDKTLKDYWISSFDVLYDAFFYELASNQIIEAWCWIDLIISLLIVLTVLGSAICGWALWASQNGKVIWGCFAAAAFGLVIFHGALAVPSRIRREGERRQLFCAVRVDLQSFRASLLRGADVLSASKRLGALRARLHDCISITPPDIVFTLAAQRSVQALVNEKLRKFING